MRTSRLIALLVALAPLTAGCAASGFFSVTKSGPMSGGKQGNGRWTYWWYAGGPKKAQGTYVADRQVGEWTYWHKNGIVEWTGSFSDNRLGGQSTFYYDDGTRRCAGTFLTGSESGVWTFWGANGSMERQGVYADGAAALRWNYWDANQQFTAEGFRLKGEKVGPWTFGDGSGASIVQDYPLPSGYAIVREDWEDGTPRRDGFLSGGRPTGFWVTRHQNGATRIAGPFVNGEAEGTWTAWTPDGVVLARGEMKGGEPKGSWQDFSGPKTATLRTRDIKDPGAAGWLEDTETRRRSTGELVGAWLAEIGSPAQADTSTSVLSRGSAPAGALAQVDSLARIPIRSQPDATVRELEAFDDFVEAYTNGVKPPSRRSRGRGYAPGGGAAAKSPEGDTDKSDPFVGKPLPFTEVYGADGQVFDLKNLQGDRNVVVVILIGFEGQVCIYCIEQTYALKQFAGDFDSLDTDVLIVYPGDANRLEIFKDSYAMAMESLRAMKEDEAGDYQDDIPFQMAFDADTRMVKALGIEGHLADPSVFVIDKQGIVRYAFIGVDKANRAPVKKVVEVLESLE
jgi:antitoxin component YwqK of YwqJK toxin-antitoxin module/peroxiredoxin